jgi:hypothetical protein
MALSATKTADGGRTMRDPMRTDRLATRLMLGLLVILWVVLLATGGAVWIAAVGTGILLIALQGVRASLGIHVSIMTAVLGLLAILLGIYNLVIGPINLWHQIIPWTSIALVLFVLVMLFGETFIEGRLN